MVDLATRIPRANLILSGQGFASKTILDSTHPRHTFLTMFAKRNVCRFVWQKIV